MREGRWRGSSHEEDITQTYLAGGDFGPVRAQNWQREEVRPALGKIERRGGTHIDVVWCARQGGGLGWERLIGINRVLVLAQLCGERFSRQKT